MNLYKYLHPDRIDILENLLIRFSPPIAFNDPFEFKPVLSGIAPIEFFHKYIDEQSDNFINTELPIPLNEFEKNILKDRIREFSKKQFNYNNPYFNQFENNAKNKFSSIFHEKSNDLIGVLSLTQTSDNLLMWSHYADSHKGFCIGFNSEHAFFNQKRSENDEFYHLRKVEYFKERPNRLMIDVDGTDLFLIKSDVWQYEKEWRMCAVLSDADKIASDTSPHIHLFKFPPTAIKEIIIGVNASIDLKSKIRSLIKINEHFNHIKIRQATISEKRYELEFIDL